MADELETAALASIGGAAGDDKKAQPREDDTCRNCGAPVSGRYCGNCGQLATNFHRPIGSLTAEVLGDFFALDGRLMRTLPALMLRPGRVTASYLAGQRARYVPPFRLYLLSSLLFFFMLFGVAERSGWFDERYIPADRGQVELSQADDGDGLAANLYFDEDDAVDANTSDSESAPSSGETYTFLREDGRVNRDELNKFLENNGRPPDGSAGRLAHQLANAYENQQFFYANVQSWAPRLALLLTPVLVITLTLLFVFKSGIYVYDHIITTLHLQSWLFLMISALLILGAIGVPSVLLNLVGYLAPPIYLYRLLRVTYGAGRFFGVFRTILILLISNLAIIVVVLGAFGASIAGA